MATRPELLNGAAELNSADSTITHADERAPIVARIAVALLVAGCLVGVVWGFGSGANQTGKPLPKEIEMVDPVQNALTVPSQSSITVDLKFGYDAALLLDGVEIPLDQTTYEKATAVLRFTPGPGKDLRELPGGLRSATVVYWPVTGDRETNGQAFSWTFSIN